MSAGAQPQLGREAPASRRRGPSCRSPHPTIASTVTWSGSSSGREKGQEAPTGTPSSFPGSLSSLPPSGHWRAPHTLSSTSPLTVTSSPSACCVPTAVLGTWEALTAMTKGSSTHCRGLWSHVPSTSQGAWSGASDQRSLAAGIKLRRGVPAFAITELAGGRAGSSSRDTEH